MRNIYWKIGYLVASLAVVFLDQSSKAWAVQRLKTGADIEVISGLLNFAYAINTGAAFSLFAGNGDSGRWMLSGLAFVASALVLYFFWRTPRNDDRILGALSLLLAGILGNVFDRIRLGYVVDFIDVQFGAWHYPTFNVADIAICTGAGLLILDMLLGNKTEKAEAAAEVAESTEGV